VHSAACVSPSQKEGLEGLSGGGVRHVRSGCKWKTLRAQYILIRECLAMTRLWERSVPESPILAGCTDKQHARRQSQATSTVTSSGGAAAFNHLDAQARSRYGQSSTFTAASLAITPLSLPASLVSVPYFSVTPAHCSPYQPGDSSKFTHLTKWRTLPTRNRYTYNIQCYC
jgi:hypothetical protein